MSSYDKKDTNPAKKSASIFYASKSPESDKKPTQKKRKTDQYAKNDRRSNRDNEKRSSRIESFKPKAKSDAVKAENNSSPWGDRSKISSEKKVHSPRREQFKSEIYVYGENSCNAVLAHRPESIIKAFISENKVTRFKELVSLLVQSRLGYDVVSDDKLAKLTETSHHGGICLIVKRREILSVTEYIDEPIKTKQDTLLAIDDINNPHNLGGIARTAAFFGVNGLILRDANQVENGASLRVSEGGSESMELIESDDFISDLDRLQKSGYKITALLPVKARSIKHAKALNSVKFGKGKNVFVIFQQINEKITDIADEVIYLEGSEAMPALNISVLTGILLAQWRLKM